MRKKQKDIAQTAGSLGGVIFFIANRLWGYPTIFPDTLQGHLFGGFTAGALGYVLFAGVAFLVAKRVVNKPND